MRVLLSTLAIFATSCANTGGIADLINYADQAEQIATEIAVPTSNAVCGAIVKQCYEAEDDECRPWQACDKARSVMVSVIIQLKLTIFDAKLALAMGDQETASQKVSLVLKLLSQVQEHVKYWSATQ